MSRLTIRIDFDDHGSFGPGKARLLELIAELASLRKAAAAMEMSYRQAWLLVQAIEQSFGAPVVETSTGGAHGGGSRLTSLGSDVLKRYRAIERKAGQSSRAEMAEFVKLSGKPRNGGPAKRKLRPRRKT